MLKGKRVILEEIDRSNIEQMRQWRNDPELRQYFREWKDISKDMQDKWYSSMGNNSNPNAVYFQISEYFDAECEKRGDVSCRRLIGCCGLLYINWLLRSAEFSVFLGASRGSGKGTEALTLLFDYGFKEMNLHKIWCEVFDNNASVNLYRRLGFKDEGVMRDNYFCNGKYGNSYRLSILENEWFELRK